MSITKEKVVDQITVQENGTILYREATRIIEDGTELTKTYHRNSLTQTMWSTLCGKSLAWTGNTLPLFRATHSSQASRGQTLFHTLI
jgi:hypothetical protein